MKIDKNDRLSAPSDTSQKDSSSHSVPSCPEKIPNLSGSQEIADTLLTNSVSAPKQSPSQSAALADRKSPELTKVLSNGQKKRPAQIQSLQISASGIDTPTLMKILAFTYHQEVKQQNELISNLKSEYGHKVQELSAAMVHCQSLEQSIGELHDQANTMGAEIDSLKQQLTNAQSSTHVGASIEPQLQIIHGKLDTILQERRKEHTESVELGKALGVIRQMADELRQYRSQAQKTSPQKIANAMAGGNTEANSVPSATIAVLPESSQAINSSAHATDGTLMQAPKQQTEVQGKVTMSKNDSQPSHHTQQDGNHTKHNEGGLTEDIAEDQDDSAVSATDPAVPMISSMHAEIGRRGMNKFGKRKHTDTYSECSQTSERKKSSTKTSLASSKMIAAGTPSKKTCLRSANYSVNITEINSSQSKTEASEHPSGDNKDHAAPAKGKSSRGQAGV